jgi:hypothetical protein
MTPLVLAYQPDSWKGLCGLCATPVVLAEGPRLLLADRRRPVCTCCARRAAPELAALVALAGAAQRVGRINRHTVTPPLSALLELARAAETYSTSASAPRLCRHAA